MRVRIPKQDNDQDPYILVEEKEPERKYVARNPLSGAIVPYDDAELTRHILSRHVQLMENDIYGRYNVFKGLAFDRISKNQWPDTPDAPKIAILANNEESTEDKYRRLGDALISEYMNTMIRIGLCQSPSILQTLPVIDISSVGPARTSKKRTSSIAMTEFTSQEMHEISEYGWKAFLPYFNEQVIRVNKNRYIYVKQLSADKRSRKMEIHVETYIGDKNTWLIIGKGDLTFSFKKATANAPAPCDIAITNGDMFEILLSRGIKATKWDKKTRTMWCDMFSCAEKPTDCQIIYLTDVITPDDEKRIPDAHVFVNSKKELNAMQKVFGACCTTLVGQNLQEHYDGMLLNELVPEYLNAMATLFFALQSEPTITENNGVITQKFKSTTVTSAEKIKRRG